MSVRRRPTNRVALSLESLEGRVVLSTSHVAAVAVPAALVKGVTYLYLQGSGQGTFTHHQAPNPDLPSADAIKGIGPLQPPRHGQGIGLAGWHRVHQSGERHGHSHPLERTRERHVGPLRASPRRVHRAGVRRLHLHHQEWHRGVRPHRRHRQGRHRAGLERVQNELPGRPQPVLGALVGLAPLDRTLQEGIRSRIVRDPVTLM